MILAKELKWLVSRWIAFMNESADALLPCCHYRVDLVNSLLTRTAVIARFVGVLGAGSTYRPQERPEAGEQLPGLGLCVERLSEDKTAKEIKYDGKKGFARVVG